MTEERCINCGKPEEERRCGACQLCGRGPLCWMCQPVCESCGEDLDPCDDPWDRELFDDEVSR